LTAAILAAVVTTGISLAMGASFGDALMSGALAFASTMGAHAIGSYFNGLYPGGLEGFQTALANGAPDWGIELARGMSHGVFQGGLTELAGGEFKSGFLAGMTGSVAGSLQMTGTSQSIMGLPGDGDTGGLALRTVSAAVVGGTASEIGGGKFANGATTAAFVHLFNVEQPRAAKIREAKEKKAQVGIGRNIRQEVRNRVYGLAKATLEQINSLPRPVIDQLEQNPRSIEYNNGFEIIGKNSGEPAFIEVGGGVEVWGGAVGVKSIVRTEFYANVSWSASGVLTAKNGTAYFILNVDYTSTASYSGSAISSYNFFGLSEERVFAPFTGEHTFNDGVKGWEIK
jgi:hypothetical protein